MVHKNKRHIFFLLLVPCGVWLLLFTRGVASFPSQCTLRQTARGLPLVGGALAGELAWEVHSLYIRAFFIQKKMRVANIRLQMQCCWTRRAARCRPSRGTRPRSCACRACRAARARSSRGAPRSPRRRTRRRRARPPRPIPSLGRVDRAHIEERTQRATRMRVILPPSEMRLFQIWGCRSLCLRFPHSPR